MTDKIESKLDRLKRLTQAYLAAADNLDAIGREGMISHFRGAAEKCSAARIALNIELDDNALPEKHLGIYNRMGRLKDLATKLVNDAGGTHTEALSLAEIVLIHLADIPKIVK